VKKLYIDKYEWCDCPEQTKVMCGCGDKHLTTGELEKTLIHWMNYHWDLNCAFKSLLKVSAIEGCVYLMQLEWACYWRCREIKLQKKIKRKRWKHLRKMDDSRKSK